MHKKLRTESCEKIRTNRFFILIWLFNPRQWTRCQLLAVSTLICALLGVFICYPDGRKGNFAADVFAVLSFFLFGLLVLSRLIQRVQKNV